MVKDTNYIIQRTNRTSYEELAVDETIFTLGNGSLGTRGHFVEGYGIFDYPQTLKNGFYNTHALKYEENYKQFPQIGQTIVNLIDASYIKIEIGEETIDLAHQTLIHLDRTLNLRTGLYQRHATYLTHKGFHIDIYEDKIIDPSDQHIATRLKIMSKDYEGDVILTSYLRMPLDKQANPLDPRLPVYHKNLEHLDSGISNTFGYMTAKTTQTHEFMGVGMTHDHPLSYELEAENVLGIYKTKLKKNQNITLTKHAFYETHDFETLNQRLEQTYPSFEQILEASKTYYDTFWTSTHIQMEPRDIELAYRYQMFQLNLSGGVDRLTSVAAKGLSGEGYDGHYFWDAEIYVLPYYALTQPHKAKNLLMFRYHKLNEAREEARLLGISKGAKIPWRTINGKEASSYFPAGSSQIHINSDLAYALYMYICATKDDQFLEAYGIELLLETAMFLLEYGHFKDDQFHIYGVTGPDEYTAIVDDNYYTNRLAKFHFEWVYHLVSTHENYHLKMMALGYTEKDLENLKTAADHMTLLYDKTLYIIEQDASFLSKKLMDLRHIPKSHFPLLLNYHPQFIYKHQVLKQADAIIACVLFKDIDSNMYENTFDYYLEKTTHDSSLSKCIYGIAAYHLKRTDLAFSYLKDSVFLDLEDTKHYTRHGLHVANLGGSYLMLLYGLLGFKWAQHLEFCPVKQSDVSFTLHINYQNQLVKLTLNENEFKIETEHAMDVVIDHNLFKVEKTYTYKL